MSRKKIVLTNKEVLLIKRKYHKYGAKKISKLLNISLSKTYKLAKELNVFKKSELSEDEKNYIIDNYAELGAKKISEVLNIKSKKIERFASENNLFYKGRKKITEEEVAFIKKNYNTIGRNGISKILNRPKITIATQAKKLSLTGNAIAWTNKEDKFLIKNSDRSITELSSLMNRSYHSIACRKSMLRKLGKIK